MRVGTRKYMNDNILFLYINGILFGPSMSTFPCIVKHNYHKTVDNEKKRELSSESANYLLYADLAGICHDY